MMQAALDGELDREERARLDGHLSACNACAMEFSSYELSAALLTAMPAPLPGPSFAAEAVRKARLAKQLQARKHRTFTWSMTAVLAAVSAVALGAWAGVLQPILWGIVAGIPRFLSGLLTMLGTLVAPGRVFLALGRAAAALSWEGIIEVFPIYMIALVTIILMAFLTRVRRPAARLPVLSL